MGGSLAIDQLKKVKQAAEVWAKEGREGRWQVDGVPHAKYPGECSSVSASTLNGTQATERQE